MTDNPGMDRFLVRITKARYVSYEHLVGSVAIAYPDSRALKHLLRLPARDPLLGNTRYVHARELVYEPIRPTTFDDFEVP